jgi:hypothetical protein
MLVQYFGEAARPHTMVLIDEIPDGGYARADEEGMSSRGRTERRSDQAGCATLKCRALSRTKQLHM